MNIPRMTVVTLGVADLARSRRFYEAVFGAPPRAGFEGIAFFELPGVWLTLFPVGELAVDISPGLSPARAGFAGFTLAHNAASRADVLVIFEHAIACGARAEKPPQDTSWGGFSGYFSDPDGYYWEVVWGPMFEHATDGSLRFKE
jgi:uncharacterized protein